MAWLCLILGAAFAGALAAWARQSARAGAVEERFRQELAGQRTAREAEAREQAERTAALFDRMVEGLIVIDAGGAIRLANRAAGALFSFEAPASGRSLLETVRHHEVAAVAARLERESEVLGYEVRLEGAGPPRFIQINALALRDRDGRADGAILVFHDMTRLRQLEAVRQEFVGNVSHELRTPLSLIKSAVETLLDGGKEDPAALLRFLQIIERHTQRLTLVIDDLLLLSTLDSGRIRLQLEPVAVRAAVQDAMDDFQARAQSRGAALVNDVPAAMIVRADPERLRQVISNLLDNAIKYGRPEGRVRARARAFEGRIEVEIQDDGPGISPESQARVFERFYRVDKGRSREQGGTGLGLAIVKHVIQAHGGDVAVRSEAGAGTSFSFTLPAAAGSSGPAGELG